MKKVLFVIIGLVVLYFILCLVGPKNIHVERSVNVNADPETVKKNLLDLPYFQEKWSPWTELDPKMEVTYTGNPGSVGHGYTWKGNKDVGAGTLTIEKIGNDTIHQNLRFEGMGDSKTYYAVKPENNGSKVTWGIDMEIGFMGRAFMLFMNMDKMMGADFEKGLNKFKTAIENTPAAPAAANYEVKELEWPEKTFVGKKELVTFDKIPTFFGENLGKIYGELGKNKIEPQMAPLGIFWTFDEQKQQTEMAAAMCVPKGTKLKGFEVWDVPASKVLHVAYYGDYSKTMDAHNTIAEYMKKNNLNQSLVLEEYANDPAEVKDTAQWLTNIYYILAPSGK